MYGITCRAWHHDASNSSNGPPVILPFCIPRRFLILHWVWEGILEIPRDLTKIQSGMWENVRFVDWVRDLTATMGARFAKILAKKKTVFGTEMTEVWDAGLTWKRNGKAGSGRLRDFHGLFFLAGARNKSFLTLDFSDETTSKMFQTKVCSVLKSS